MATSSITHNFVITDKKSAEKFSEVFERPKVQKSNISVESVSGADNVRLLVKKWKTSIK